MHPTLAELWPPFALTVTCGPLTLTAISDSDLPALVAAAMDGVHDTGRRPFSTDWAASPMPELGRELARRYWASRADFRPDSWDLPLVVRYDGEVVGVQGAEAQRFPILRTPDTYSWLARSAHGHGIGTLMRRAVCALLFDELDARAVTSGTYTDNPASATVSHKVGFRTHAKREARDDKAGMQDRFILTPDRFVRPDKPITIVGGSTLRSYAGVARDSDT